MSLIQDLGQILSVDDIAQELGLTPVQMVNLWKNLLNDLKTGNISLDSPAPLTDSILDYIKKNSNLSVDELKGGEIYNAIKESDPASDFWNSSVVDAIEYFKANIELEDTDTIIDPYTVSDLKNSDAGKSFTNIPWVHPNENSDGDAYENVRGGDAVLSVLKNNRNITFTREAGTDKWLRLIMPMNSRHVEVEDLNRNFWVIAITLTALSSYLFNKDNPLSEMVKRLMDEITQLWENIIYIWTDVAKLTQKKNGSVHIEVIPVANESLVDYVKFDNFEDSLIYYDNDIYWKKVVEKVEYLKYKYADQDLVVIPVMRKYNYQRNWYKAEVYPYILFYKTNKDEWFHANIKYNRSENLTFDITNGQTSFGPVFGKYLAAARENKADYFYYYPFSEVNQVMGYGVRMYGLARIIPNISVEPYGEGFKINRLKWEIEDAATSIKEGTCVVKIINALKDGPITITEDGAIINIDRVEDAPGPSWIEPTHSTAIETIKSDRNKYYMGELLSYYNYTASPTFEGAEFKIVKIGDFIPEDVGYYSTIGLTDIANLYQKLDYVSKDAPIYNQDTYGVGAMRFNVNTTMQGFSTPHLGFLNYCSIDHKKYPSTSGIGGYETEWYEGYSVTPELLSALSVQRIKNLVILGKLPNEQALYATKIGINFWTGNDGPQWSCGLVCNLVYYDGQGGAVDIGFVGLMDGYWTSSYQVFTQYPPVNGNRWRRLALTADVEVKQEEEEYVFNFYNGMLVWYDHNREVYYGITDEPLSRPHAVISLDEMTDYHVLSFTDLVNPITSNNLLCPYILPPIGHHIFKEDAARLNVNQALGVLPWVNGSYDPSDVNVAISANLNGYIVTQESV